MTTEEERLTDLEEAINLLAKSQKQTNEVLASIVKALNDFVEAAKKAGIK